MTLRVAVAVDHREIAKPHVPLRSNPRPGPIGPGSFS